MGENALNLTCGGTVELGVRGFFLAFIVALTSGAMAQVTVGPDTLETALLGLRSSSALALALRGEDQTGSRTIPFRVNLYYVPASATLGPKVEVWSYRGETLDRLLVGDGAEFVRYDVTHNQYSITPYKTAEDAMRLLQTMGGGNIALPVRLIRDMMATERWQPWLRNARIEHPGAFRFALSSGNPEHSRLEFRFAEPFRPDTPVLKEIISLEHRAGMSTTWTMRIVPNFEPSATQFKFVPPAGAKAVASSASTKTGS